MTTRAPSSAATRYSCRSHHRLPAKGEIFSKYCWFYSQFQTEIERNFPGLRITVTVLKNWGKHWIYWSFLEGNVTAYSKCEHKNYWDMEYRKNHPSLHDFKIYRIFTHLPRPPAPLLAGSAPDPLHDLTVTFPSNFFTWKRIWPAFPPLPAWGWIDQFINVGAENGSKEQNSKWTDLHGTVLRTCLNKALILIWPWPTCLK